MYRLLYVSFQGIVHRIIYQVLAKAISVVIDPADQRENLYKCLQEMKWVACRKHECDDMSFLIITKTARSIGLSIADLMKLPHG